MRYYGKYGKYNLEPEDQNRCIVEVTYGLPYGVRQCSYKRGFGEEGMFCIRHAKKKNPRVPKDVSGG